MSEKVVVSQAVPHFLPKFENPIYKLALNEEKRKLRLEIIDRIKNGTFENGIAPLYKSIGSFTKEEIHEIITFWKDNNRELLLWEYFYSIMHNDLKKIELADKSYLLVVQNIKNDENLGRI